MHACSLTYFTHVTSNSFLSLVLPFLPHTNPLLNKPLACLGYFIRFYEAGSSLKKGQGKNNLTNSSAYEDLVTEDGRNSGSTVLQNTMVEIELDSKGDLLGNGKLDSFA